MTTLHSQLLLNVHAENFVRAHWAGRASRRNFPWIGDAPDKDLASFAWFCFLDTGGPSAVGLAIVEQRLDIAFYRVAEWHGASDIRFALWQYIPGEGWAEFRSSHPAVRRPVIS